ncbi:MAG: Beta-peptidyl aminopeptidase BapA [Phycisphaerae bacterium]|nr:Beta-peptidyl aminopeptidase BapA [Phycisphaerae bacterium]
MSDRKRARELGIVIGRLATGEHNAITDVAGVRVGHASVVRGDDVRTGVTVIRPRGRQLARLDPLFAGVHSLNGNGEMTGAHWIREAGLLGSEIAITNTHSVGTVHEAMIAWDVERRRDPADSAWQMPVVAETYDGWLNDIDGQHVKREHVFAALDSAADGPVAEGCVGGGTGMICHNFKGGIGTASRVLAAEFGGWTVGALVQANYGLRALLTVAGVPVGREITFDEVPRSGLPTGLGSIIVIVATDAPLIPSQCTRLAQRAGMGLARVGSVGADSSGDIFLAFSTANHPAAHYRKQVEPIDVRMLSGPMMSLLFEAVVEAVEESIVNALCMATTTTGIQGRVSHAIPLDRLVEVMRKYGRG